MTSPGLSGQQLLLPLWLCRGWPTVGRGRGGTAGGSRTGALGVLSCSSVPLHTAGAAPPTQGCCVVVREEESSAPATGQLQPQPTCRLAFQCHPHGLSAGPSVTSLTWAWGKRGGAEDTCRPTDVLSARVRSSRAGGAGLPSCGLWAVVRSPVASRTLHPTKPRTTATTESPESSFEWGCALEQRL